MKLFYTVNLPQDLQNIHNVNNLNTSRGVPSFTYFRDIIHYLPSKNVEKMNYERDLFVVFGSEDFNMFNDPVTAVSIEDSPLTSPVDDTWYLVSNSSTLYDNLVVLEVAGIVTGLADGEAVSSDNGASGILVSGAGTTTLKIKYNDTPFTDLDTVNEGATYVVNGNEQAVSSITSTTIANFSEHANGLVYYDVQDTTAPYKFLTMVDGFKFTYLGITYEYHNTQGDKRFKTGSTSSLNSLDSISFNLNALTDKTGKGEMIFDETILTNAQGIGAPLLASGSGWITTDADSLVLNMPCRGLALSTATSSALGTVLIKGFYRDDTAFSGYTVNAPVYVNITTGTMTDDTSGFASGDKIQKVGWMVRTGILRFEPDQTVITKL